MIDSRAGRVVDGRRDMLDDEEWKWVEEAAAGELDHLLIGTSLPWLLPRGTHGLEAWSEAVCDGAWGGAAARLVEKLRRAEDFDHWASFGRSFRALSGLLREVGAEFREPHTGGVGVDGLKLAANLRGRVRLGVEGVVLRRPAGEEQDDAPRRPTERAVGPRRDGSRRRPQERRKRQPAGPECEQGAAGREWRRGARSPRRS